MIPFSWVYDKLEIDYWVLNIGYFKLTFSTFNIQFSLRAAYQPFLNKLNDLSCTPFNFASYQYHFP